MTPKSHSPPITANSDLLGIRVELSNFRQYECYELFQFIDMSEHLRAFYSWVSHESRIYSTVSTSDRLFVSIVICLHLRP